MNRLNWLRLGLPILDSLMWLIAFLTVAIIRYNGDINVHYHAGIILYVGLAIAVSVVLGFFLRTYRHGFRMGSWEEMIALGAQVCISALVSAIVTIIAYGLTAVPAMVLVLLPPLTIFNILLARTIVRATRNLFQPPPSQKAERALIYGAGSAGRQLVLLSQEDQNSPFKIVGLIDDDPHKRRFSTSGVHVLGDGNSIVDIARSRRASTIIVASSTMTHKTLLSVYDRCTEAGLTVFRMPPLSTFISKNAVLSSIRRLDATELLGRTEVETDLSEKAGYINGKRVLITGAGGSIGSEISRQVHHLGPKELVLLDRDESALHAVQLDLYNQGLLDTRDMVLCDIRDREALRAIFEEHRPEVIFHTAALKHLPMLEGYPEEGWKTNTLGSLNLLELAEEYGVEVFVNISTDKAANPKSVLGRTKRLAERLAAEIGLHAGRRFVSVRFGNVLGSRGSMLITFRHQIEHGGPVTVTHPDIDRYFMTIPEACALVIQAGAIGRPGEVMILDMGEPIRILDVANRLISQSGQPVKVEFTGLRPGEKLSEELISANESAERPFHPLISHVTVPPLRVEQVEETHEWAITGEEADGGFEPLLPVEGK